MIPNTDILIPFRSTRQFPTEEYLEKCVETLTQHTHNYRLIFVDDNSDEVGRMCVEKMADHFPESVLIRTRKQRWFTRAVNLGLRMVKTEWAVEANSDVIFGDGWLEEMYAVRDEIINAGARVGLVGSVYAANEPRRYACSQPPNFVTGHCLLLNMRALHEVANVRGTANDFLDEVTSKAIHIFSDNHLCYDLNKLGYQTVASFKSGVGHIAGKSWGHQLHAIPQRVEDVNFKYES